jgi:hypothetical protein
MSEKKIAILLVSLLLCLGGIFRQAVVVNADSYSSGPATLQSTLNMGNTGSLTDKNTMELTATGTHEGLVVTHSQKPGANGDAILVNMGAETGTGVAIDIDSSNSGDGIKITKNAGDEGLQIDYSTAGGRGIVVNYTGTTAAAYFNSSSAGGTYNNATLLLRSTGNGAPTLYLDHSNATGHIIHANNNSADAFFVGNGGNVSAGTGVVADTTNIFYGLSDDNTGGIKLANTYNGASDDLGINLEFDREPASDVAYSGDDIANIIYKGEDASGTVHQYAQVGVTMLDTATATYSGQMFFRVSTLADEAQAPLIISGGASKNVTLAWPVIVSNTSSTPFTVESSVSTAGINVESTDAGSNGANILFIHDSASPAIDDNLAKIQFQGRDASGTLNSYSSIWGVIEDPANTVETGKLQFNVKSVGVDSDPAMRIIGGATETIKFIYPVQLLDNGTRPTCLVGTRGMFWYEEHATDDTLSVCMLAGSSYSWVTIKP